MRADLHVHSNASDGTDPPAEVMRRAARAGLDVLALTDHDTVAGHAEARAAAGDALTLLPGMELSCRLDGRSLHMLAYLFDPDQPELAAELTRIRDDRVIRARAMVDKLAGLGVDVSWGQVEALAGQAVVGRPHIARAMTASGAIASPRDAFTRDWIADGGRAYVGRYALDPVRAIGLVRAAGGVAVLAHPRAGRDTFVSDEQVAGLAAVGLAGLEVRHPDQPAAERVRLLALARDLALVATGGSDDHGSLTGYRLGAETTTAEAYEALVSGARPGGSVLPQAALGAPGDVHAVGRESGGDALRIVRGDDRPDRRVQVQGDGHVLARPARVEVEPVPQVAAAVNAPLPHQPERAHPGLADVGVPDPLSPEKVVVPDDDPLIVTRHPPIVVTVHNPSVTATPASHPTPPRFRPAPAAPAAAHLSPSAPPPSGR